MGPRITLAGLALFGALAGCARPAVERPDVDADAIANPEVAIVKTMERVAKAMDDLRAGRGARGVVPAELQRPVTWRFTGPLDQAAQALAERVGYAYAPPGPDAPAMPVVAINAQATPAIEVFRTLGEQVGSAVAVVVDPETRIVQVKRHV